jgi:cation diffusion facilitator CzcD-associated flavoprotein CzcO
VARVGGLVNSNTLVVGAGPAGLAVASCLKARGVHAVVLEKGETVAPAWHHHYERLHLLRLLVGDISKIWIPAADWGPVEQIATKGKIPLLDIGTMAALKSGAIQARPGIDRFTETGVVFTDATEEKFDAVVFGTGYEPAVDRVLDSTVGVVDARGVPLVSGGESSEQGLYFCGFREPPTGRLREIGLEAQRIAELIAKRVGAPTAGT